MEEEAVVEAVLTLDPPPSFTDAAKAIGQVRSSAATNRARRPIPPPPPTSFFEEADEKRKKKKKKKKDKNKKKSRSKRRSSGVPPPPPPPPPAAPKELSPPSPVDAGAAVGATAAPAAKTKPMLPTERSRRFRAMSQEDRERVLSNPVELQSPGLMRYVDIP